MVNAFIRTAQAGSEPQDVACGSCTRCCKNQVVPLIPERGDDPSKYEHKSEVTDPRTGETFFVLKWDSAGVCMYLDRQANRCTIHATAPAICRNFSCVSVFLASQAYGRNERRHLIQKGHFDRGILNEGKARAFPDAARKDDDR